MTINLTANNRAEERIKAFLEENASAILADKINNGTPYEQDGKHLINRKTLDGFFKYATTEARKLAEKGANYACIDDATVFGWAIHYFEENAIIGTLYNEDGSEYTKKEPTKKEKAIKATPKPTQAPMPPKKPTEAPQAPAPIQKPTKTKKIEDTDQISLFDLF